MSIKFLVLEGGVFWVWGGGGGRSAGFIFMGAGIFLILGAFIWCPLAETRSRMHTHTLRGPVAILFISRDTCSDSIAKLFRACFVGYRTIIARYVATWGIAQMCLCETKYQGGGVSHHFWAVQTSLKK